MSGPATNHQAFQGFPNLDAPIANPDGTLTIPWYLFLISLWQKLGGSTVPTTAGVLTSATPGGKAQVVPTSGVSPFQYQALEGGQFLVTWPYETVPQFSREAGGEAIEFSRDNGTTWYLVGSAPRMIGLSTNDLVRVTWYTPGPPMMVFFPVK